MQRNDHPNLDAVDDPSELLAIASVYSSIALYARHKAAAIIARREGRIATALHNEDRCDREYLMLPECAKCRLPTPSGNVPCVGFRPRSRMDVRHRTRR